MNFNENWDGIVRNRAVVEAKSVRVPNFNKAEAIDHLNKRISRWNKEDERLFAKSYYDSDREFSATSDQLAFVESMLEDLRAVRQALASGDMKSLVKVIRSIRSEAQSELPPSLKKMIRESVEVTEAKAPAAPKHSVKVGDIFYTSWGYDQTNTEFYIVTKVAGGSVVTVEIESTEERQGGMPYDMHGKVVPHPSKKPVQGAVPKRSVVRIDYKGEPTIKVQDRMGSVHGAYPWDGKPKHVTHYA